MVPAAQHRDPEADTIMHTQHRSSGTSESTTWVTITSITTLHLPLQPTESNQHKIPEAINAQATARSMSTSTRFVTSIVTSTRTLQSSFDWPTATPGQFPIPQIQGLIPGLRRALHLNSDSRSLSPTPSHDQALKERSTIAAPRPTELSISTTAAASPRRSTFPRVSPPGFLYPENLIPKSDYAPPHDILIQQPEGIQQNESPYQPGIMGRVDYELAYLPTGVKLLFVGTLAVLVLAVIWVILVVLINYPPGTWGYWNEGTGGGYGKGKKKKKEERRPIDKPSKYAPQTEPVEVGDSDSEGATTSALPRWPFSKLSENGGQEQDIELRQRPRHHMRSHHQRKQTQHVLPRQNQTFTGEHRRTSSSPAPGLRFSYTPTSTSTKHYAAPTISAPPSPTTSNLSSPPNPFLNPPKNGLLAPNAGLVKRSSTEWKRDHAVFFGNGTASRPASPAPVPVLSNHSPTHSHHSSPLSSSSYSMETHDFEALEAGTASFPALTRSSSNPNSPRANPNGVLHKSLSWIDQGLELVDGAVDGFVARVGRWTDDDGADEELLLPVARGGRMGGGVRV
jgi:hypothetical protein